MKKQLTRYTVAATLLMASYTTLLAQDTLRGIKEDDEFEETIVTDRPDQTEAPALTPKGWFQVEMGIQSEFDKDGSMRIDQQNTLYNTTLWKYGLSKNIELRLITEYANDKFTHRTNEGRVDTSSRMSGFNPISIGSKIALQKERGIIPQISLITHLELPYFGDKDFRPEYVVPRFRFVFSHTLNERFSFSYNLGAEWEDGSNAATGIYTATLGIGLLDKLGMYIEAYGFLQEKGTPDHRVDGGFTYLLNDNIQLDCSGGLGLSDNSPDYFISGGLSFRVNAFDRTHR